MIDQLLNDEKQRETLEYIAAGRMAFPIGTKAFWKIGTNRGGTAAYEKIDGEINGHWISLDSIYIVVTDGTEFNVKKDRWEPCKIYTAHPESEKPLYDENGKLNRFGFRWPDAQVYEYYKDIMYFVIPA